MPSFAQGEAADAVAEFMAFMDARPQAGADTLALLARIRNDGKGHVPTDDYVGYRA